MIWRLSPSITRIVAVSSPPRPPSSLVLELAPPCAPKTSKVTRVTPAGTVQVWAAPVYVKVQVAVVPEVVQTPESACADTAGCKASDGTSSVAPSAAPRIAEKDREIMGFSSKWVMGMASRLGDATRAPAKTMPGRQ
jgi:hypothetical protein